MNSTGSYYGDEDSIEPSLVG